MIHVICPSCLHGFPAIENQQNVYKCTGCKASLSLKIEPEVTPDLFEDQDLDHFYQNPIPFIYHDEDLPPQLRSNTHES